MKARYLAAIGVAIGFAFGIASSASAEPQFLSKMRQFTEKRIPAEHLEKMKKAHKEGKPVEIRPEVADPEGVPPKLEPIDKIRPPEIDRGKIERGPDGKPIIGKKVPLDKHDVGKPHDNRRPGDDRLKAEDEHDNGREVNLKRKDKPLKREPKLTGKGRL